MTPAVITAVVAVAAVISPMFTTFINNYFQLKLRKLDFEEERLNNTVYHKREIFEKYLFYSGRLLCTGFADDYPPYYSYYHQALLYVDDQLASKMEQAHLLFVQMDRNVTLQSLMFSISSDLKNVISSMQPKGSSKRTIIHK